MPRKAKNVLFIMFDQLRWDYLSCSGHPHLETPHIDRLASMGVRFNRAYVQSTICGSSRMCAYTGRYVHSHGVGWVIAVTKVTIYALWIARKDTRPFLLTPDFAIRNGFA